MKPSIDNIHKILVVGAGATGSQIGMVCALAGYILVVQDIAEHMLRKEELRGRMARNVEKGRMNQEQVDEAFGRITFLPTLTVPQKRPTSLSRPSSRNWTQGEASLAGSTSLHPSIQYSPATPRPS